MLVLVNLKHNVKASQKHGKLRKCPEKVFDYLFIVLHISAHECTKTNNISYMQYICRMLEAKSGNLYLLQIWYISGLIMVNEMHRVGHKLSLSVSEVLIVCKWLEIRGLDMLYRETYARSIWLSFVSLVYIMSFSDAQAKHKMWISFTTLEPNFVILNTKCYQVGMFHFLNMWQDMVFHIHWQLHGPLYAW